MAQPLRSKKTKRKSVKKSKPSYKKTKTRRSPVPSSEIELIRTTGSRKRGGGPGGETWIVMAEGKRAGIVYINMVNDAVRGLHASFHLFLNQPNQGREIGRVAYKLGCESSSHDVVYAHMRKSNAASHKAALHAGFKDATKDDDSQLVLVWYRTSDVSPC